MKYVIKKLKNGLATEEDSIKCFADGFTNKFRRTAEKRIEELKEAIKILSVEDNTKIYKIWCEWEMPVAHGYYTTKEKAQAAINEEDWSDVEYTLKEVQDDGMVSIEEINIE